MGSTFSKQYAKAHAAEKATKISGSVLTNLYRKPIEVTAGDRIGYGAAGLGLGLVHGAASAIEGIGDFFAGTALQLVGDKEGAKEVYQNSWSGDFRKWINEEINPDDNKAFSTYLDVVSGVGNAATQVGLMMLTGGASGYLGAGATAVKVASVAPLFISATGSGTAEAVQTTGELGVKENVYGALTGSTELATEMVLGAGGKILKGSKLFGKAESEAVKGITKHAIIRGTISSAAGEFGEEAMSEAASVWWKQLTGVDPNAKMNGSDIVRAGFMGAVSGGVLGFGNSAITARTAQNAGRKIIENGTEKETVAEASALVKAATSATKGNLDNMDSVQRVKKALELYQSDANAPTSRKAYYLGQMSAGLFEVGMYESSKGYRADIFTTVAQGGEAATKIINGANALFEETLGRKLTAEDFSSTDSVGTKMLASVSLYNDLATPTDAELVDISIRNESAVAFSPDQMASDIAALKDGEGTAVYNLGGGRMAIVTKRKGDGSISVGLVENKNTNAIKATHGIKSIEGAVSLVKSMQDGTYGQPRATATPAQPKKPTKKKSILDEEFKLEISEKNVEMPKKPEAAKAPKKPEAPKKAEAAKKAEAKKKPEVSKPTEKSKAEEPKTEKKKAPEKEAKAKTESEPKKEAPEELSAVEDRLRGKKYAGTTFTAEEINAARADFKYLDALSPKVRSDILVMRRSAKEAKIDAQKVKGLTRLMAAYKFSATFSSKIKSNGFWRHGKNLLVINPNDIYQTTFGHELSHRVEDYKGYDEFASAVESLVGKARLDAEMKQYLADYNAAAEANGWKKWDAEANAEDLKHEAVANIVGKYLSNAEYIDKLANADRNFVYRIYRSIKGMKRDLALANQISNEADTSSITEYRTIRRMEKVFETSLGLTEKVGDTLVGMERGDGISYNLASYKKKMIRIEDEDGNATVKSGREILSEMLRKNPNLSESDIKDTLDQIDSVASELEKFGAAFDNFVKWSDASIEYNPDSGELVLTSLVKNGEYEMNIDFSTICKKRVAFTNVLNAIVRSGKDIHLTPTKIAHINTVLAEHGFETACKMCFVESKRNNLQAWAKNFVNGKGGKNAQKGWNALVKSVNPNATPFALVKEKSEVSDEDILELDHSLRSDIAANTEVLDAVIQARVDADKKDNTESKIAKLLKEHPEYAHTLEKEDLFGSEGVTALKSKYPEVYSILLSSYGVATPKITLPAAPYASELAVASEVQKHNTKKQTVSDYTLSIGGVRVQSFSDYMVLRFFDYVQMIADGASQGMAMQSYTKEISYAYLFGKTGMKINLSIVPRVDAATVKKYGKDYAGLIAREDGTFDYAFAKESIQLDDKVVDGRLVKGAFSLINEEGYRGNVGTILIGVSRQHILKALADPRISMVIPYHKSGLNKTMASLYGIADFVDYTNVQNTRDAEGAKFKKDPFDFYASYRKHKGDSKKVADEYLAFCDENGYLPKFDEFRGDPNYYKLLIDFTSDYTDASGKRHVVQQGAVKLNLPDDWMDVVKADLGVEQKTSSKLDAEMDSIIKEVLSEDITNAQAAARQKKLDEDISRSVSSRIVFGTPANTVGVKERAKGVIEKVKGIVTDKAERRAALEKLREATDHFSVYASNSFAAVETQLRRMKDGTFGRMTRQAAQEQVQLIRVAEAKGLGMLTVAQYKFDGTPYEHSEALLKILEPTLAKKGETITGTDAEGNDVSFKAKGGELGGELYQEVSDYLGMLNAIEREAVGKNPYGNMTVAQMQSIVKDYESKHPEFKEIAEKWSRFNRNLLQYRVDAGLMSQDTADKLHARYPHYIPMMKPTTDNLQSTGAIRGKSSVEVANNIRKAKGGDHLVNDPIATYCNMVLQTVKAAQVNDLMLQLYKTADDKHVITDERLKEIGEEMDNVAESYINDPDSNPDAFGILKALTVKASDGLTNAVYFYEDGVRKAMKVSKDIFTGLQGANKSGYNFTGGWMFEGMAAINSNYKRLITSMNPFFSPKNMIRDFMDGLLHSRFKLREFLIEYGKVGKEMLEGKITDDPLWAEFIANGGLQSSLFDRHDAKLSKRSKRTGLESSDAGLVGKTMQTVENFNVLIEALPRFTEYKLTRNKGGTVAEAINNSAEVTTNFARSGVAGGFLNKTIMPFLNPAIQGFSKPIRNVIENGTPKGLVSLLIRAALLGVAPIILNNLMYGDDEDYDVLEDSTKENNFVIKIGDSWLKIPRGRVVSVVSGLYNRSYNQMTGRYVDWKDYLDNVKSQATPIDSITRTIFSPFKDVQTNTTWYGGTIENESMQNLAPEDRYDEYTSSLAIAIGKVTGKAFDLSPKKVHYLLDQYSGIIGDLLLPMTSTATRSNPLSSNFSVDVTQNTNLSDRFYKIYNDSMYKKNKGDEEAYYLYKRLGETKQQVSELYKQIKEINTSNLSKSEKRSQVAVLRATINQLYKAAIADAGAYSKAVKAASPIQSYYKVVKVTSANAKKLGAEKESIGKYALTYNGETVRFFDDAAAAEEYKTSVARKTTYAEANRLVYGAQYALNQYSEALGTKAETVARLGVDAETFYSFYMTTRYYSGSDKKKRIEKYCKENGLSKAETSVILYFAGFKSYREEVQSIAKRNGFSKSEIEDL